MRIEELDLSQRAYEHCQRLGAETVEQLKEILDKDYDGVPPVYADEILGALKALEPKTEIIADDKYTAAYTLHRRIVVNAQSAQESLFEVCKGLKEMRDKELYKELGYENFKDYSQAELGMTSRNANRYISIAEMVDSSGTSMSPNIGTTRLYLLSTLAEEDRKEITETTDLEQISVRELQKKIDELKAEKEQAEVSRDFEAAEHIKVSNENSNNKAKIVELEDKIKELESRPVEVAVEKDKEAEKQIAELRSQLEETKEKLRDEQAAAKNDIKKALDEQAAEHKKETDKLRDQLAKKPKEIKVPVDEAKVEFKIRLTSAYEPLMRAAETARASEEFKEKFLQLLDAARKAVESDG